MFIIVINTNKQNSSELIRLPVKVFNTVAFKYLQDMRELKNIKVLIFFRNIHLDLGCKGNLCQQI